MSNLMYNKMWHQTQEALNSLLDNEKMTEPQRNKVIVFQMLATFYIKYVQIFRNMENVYDQIVHPQKRLLIRKILDAVMGRILELKNEMVELEMTEFHYFDDILQDLKLAPQQLDVPIPRYFVKERLEVIKEREKILSRILSECGLNLTDPKYAAKAIPLEEAIKLIQVAERARQGRLRAMFMKQIYLQECRAKEIKLLGRKAADTGVAALQIQKVWRGFNQNRKTLKAREDEMVFLGMVSSAFREQRVCVFALGFLKSENRTETTPYFNDISAAIVQSEKVQCLRNEVQQKHEENYKKALVSIKEELKAMEGLGIKEHLQDQIRQWFIECRNLTGTFPEYPNEEEGGSAVIFTNKTPEQVVEDILANQEEEEKLKKKKKKEERETRVQRRKTDEKRGFQKEKSKEEDDEWKMSPSFFFKLMEEGNSSYKDVWMHKDESWNFPQDYDPEIIKEEKRRELESEIRVQVDELMRQELKNLKLAVNKEIELPGKAKKAKKQGKGKKGRRGKRGKKDRDLTADRTIESLYKELVEEGLLIQAVKVNLSDYIGEYSYLGTTLRQVAIEPMPSLLDVRQLVTLYGILPLGVGKKMLVHAICTETGANLFNLSASNIAGKYPGKNGLQMMLHLVFKVARELQPSVVWIQDTEKTFYKKVPQAEKRNEPKRLKRHLPRMLKLLKPNDRILIVGTTQRPFDAELQPFCRVYQKIILVPRPDYASRYVLWKEIIIRNGGLVTNSLNISCLSKVTDGFTQGQIVKVIKEVLTDRRVRQQAHKPLTAVEFITMMTSMNPVYKEEEESFKNWYAKTPLGRKRMLSLTVGNKEKEKEKGNKKVKKEKRK